MLEPDLFAFFRRLPSMKRKKTKDSGLIDNVEFKTGDPTEILQDYEKIDFSLVDCKNDDYPKFVKMINVNPKKAAVVANNLEGGKEGLGGLVVGMKDKVKVRSMKHPIDKGMEITTIGITSKMTEWRDQGDGGQFRAGRRRILMKNLTSPKSSKWVVKVDEESGEEHIFRLPRSV